MTDNNKFSNKKSRFAGEFIENAPMVVADEVAAKEEVKPAKVKITFTHELWRGVKEVLKCTKCGTFRDTKDPMIEHILLHYPKSEQEAELERLLKEK